MANEKHIFIGIGGSGCQTVSQIKEKVYEKRFQVATATKSRFQAMSDNYRFLFLDTDQRDIDEANKRNRATFEQGKVPFINPQTDLINLGRANPNAIYYEAKQDPNVLMNKRILEACSPELATKIPDQPLAFGAGAFRMKSRLAFAHSLADFQSKVQAAISSLNDVKTVGGGDCIIYYWVVGSTLGGTGSGIFNDVLYHLNQIHHQVVGNGDPQLVLTMYMPKVYIDSNATEEKYTLNAFGVFSELEAFKAMSFKQKQNTVMHRLAFQNDYTLIDSNKRYCPFYYLIPIDIQTDKGTSLGTTRTMYRNTAEMLYHLHHGKAGATFRSDIDNYMNDIMERNNKDFLVPMGYVSLQKPNEQFYKYMRFRLRRDILRNWLLNENGKETKIEMSKIDSLVTDLFSELDSKIPGSIANKIANQGSALKELYETLESQDSTSENLNSELTLENIETLLANVQTNIKNESNITDKRDEHKRKIIANIWSQAEKWIRSCGLTYAYDAITLVREKLFEDYKNAERTFKDRSDALAETREQLEGLYKEAATRSLKEKTIGSNKDDIAAYISAVTAWVDESIKLAIDMWSNDLLKDFCTDEKNDELSKLRKHVASFKDKAAEMNTEAAKLYAKLATDMGTASMDVTTVYLPQLTKIADGNGWVSGNIFSRLYTGNRPGEGFIRAQEDEAETPERLDLEKFLEENIYNTVKEEFVQEIKSGQYEVVIEKEDEKTKEIVKSSEVRYFCNSNLDRSSEKIIEDFLSLAIAVLEQKMRDSDVIRDKWSLKKISAFFADLTNEEKDSVRNSLNPALFFSYNANRIDVVKKEEHVVFVAGTEDLATEMLGFQKGNPKHRYEKADDENTALVLKSKYGLSLADYRIYDSIKSVYDKATFREKYHFHHDFAQFLDKLTLDDMPIEVLPQHRSYAKMLILNQFKEETSAFFYHDEYDREPCFIAEDKEIFAHTDVMFFSDCDTSFRIAQPEAFSIHPTTGEIVLKVVENGRVLYKEIEGPSFVDQFNAYCDMFYNYRFGETIDAILLSILRQTRNVNGQNMNGDMVFKKWYTAKHKELLEKLNDLKKNAMKPAEKNLYSVLFTIVREEFDTVHKFIK
jgi:hypothetical protein